MATDAPPPDRVDTPRLLSLLEEMGLEARTFEHEPVFTVAEAKVATAHVPGTHCKNLLLEERGGSTWLVVLPEEKPLDLKSLAGLLGARRLSFASAGTLAARLGVPSGAVSPFAIVNDPGSLVRVVLDRSLLSRPALKFHPLVNTRTTVVPPGALLRFLAAASHPPVLVDLDP